MSRDLLEISKISTHQKPEICLRPLRWTFYRWIHPVNSGDHYMWGSLCFQFIKSQVKNSCITLHFHKIRIMVCVLRNFNLILHNFILPEVKDFSKLKTVMSWNTKIRVELRYGRYLSFPVVLNVWVIQMVSPIGRKSHPTRSRPPLVAHIDRKNEGHSLLD